MTGPSLEPGPPPEGEAPVAAEPTIEPAPSPEGEAPVAAGAASTPGPGSGPAGSPRASQGEAPLYKGEPLEAERGPGLGCFWVQVSLLGILLVLTPLTVVWAWPAEVSAVLLLVTLALLLFAGQTVIFLLRLVAADRRSRRVPRSASARRTVGMLEDEGPSGDRDTRPESAPAVTPDDGEPPAER